jgi:hypothetical protein
MTRTCAALASSLATVLMSFATLPPRRTTARANVAGTLQARRP